MVPMKPVIGIKLLSILSEGKLFNFSLRNFGFCPGPRDCMTEKKKMEWEVVVQCSRS